MRDPEYVAERRALIEERDTALQLAWDLYQADKTPESYAEYQRTRDRITVEYGRQTAALRHDYYSGE